MLRRVSPRVVALFAEDLPLFVEERVLPLFRCMQRLDLPQQFLPLFEQGGVFLRVQCDLPVFRLPFVSQFGVALRRVRGSASRVRT